MSFFKILEIPEISHLFRLFHEGGAEVRLVGGCVRDALLGIKTNDIDMAVNVVPEKAKEILENADIKVIPTGIEHGTMTAVLHKIPFQITSLRQDWQTDGRHAKVIFGKDWLEDAKRRDFTINALSLDKDGVLYDPFEGRADLEKGIIRFIGNPATRIQEDYLRILRYYRFLAYYGKGEPKPIPELKECSKGLASLSKERISQEFLKLLGAKNPLISLTLMKKDGIFLSLFAEDPSLEKIESIAHLENLLGIQISTIRRLYALFHDNNKLLLSNEQKKHLHCLNKALLETDRRRIYYYFGEEITLDWALWSKDYKENLSWLNQQSELIFPLKGQDLLDKGVNAGRSLGVALKKTEDWWVSKDFAPNKQECLEYCLGVMSTE
ncbi:MAG: CCA tRNA nucleotidyltransferase [Alphaproteobacteria bacterium]|jgi:poly(A) polymerase|nr:CCA tRNA nucleotidyltransferase [Alphaproteobacteria bacterium]